MLTFKQMLNDDLDSTFFNLGEFGETVTLTRAGESFTMKAIFDVQCLDGEDIGGETAISHRPRLHVRAVDLPNRVARKSDKWSIAQNELHDAAELYAVDIASEADGVVVIELEYQSRAVNG